MTSPPDALLAVQELDTTTDQLRHRRATLPARAELKALRQQLASVDASLVTVGQQRHELERQQGRLEDEIASLSAKATAVDKTMYSGTVRNPRELQAMQEEIDALKRRQRHLEDEAMDILEQSEPVDEELATLEASKATLDAAAATAVATIAEGEAEIDGQLGELVERRAAAAAPVPDDVLAEYDQLRGRLGGVAVARLVGAQCGGCHLALAAVELDEIRHLPPDTPARCSACGRLLVR